MLKMKLLPLLENWLSPFNSFQKTTNNKNNNNNFNLTKLKSKIKNKIVKIF